MTVEEGRKKQGEGRGEEEANEERDDMRQEEGEHWKEEDGGE